MRRRRDRLQRLQVSPIKDEPLQLECLILLPWDSQTATYQVTRPRWPLGQKAARAARSMSTGADN